MPLEYPGEFPRPETTAPTITTEVIPWVACFFLGGLLRSSGMPLPKKGVFDENDEIPNMLVFTESGHQIDENDEIDENTLLLAVLRAPQH